MHHPLASLIIAVLHISNILHTLGSAYSAHTIGVLLYNVDPHSTELCLQLCAWLPSVLLSVIISLHAYSHWFRHSAYPLLLAVTVRPDQCQLRPSGIACDCQVIRSGYTSSGTASVELTGNSRNTCPYCLHFCAGTLGFEWLHLDRGRNIRCFSC